MNQIYIILISLCVLAIIILVLNLSVLLENQYTALKVVCSVLFAFSMMRYMTLIIYGDMPEAVQLETLRYFYLATAIGLTIPTVSAIWYITPLYRNKINYLKYLMLFSPWIVFYLWVIITQPTQINMAPTYGYMLELTGRFPLYLSIAQGSFVIIVIAMCLIGIMKYKNEQLRSQYFVIIMGQILLALDGITYFVPVLETLPKFTVSEIIGFLGIFYAFKKKPLEIKNK